MLDDNINDTLREYKKLYDDGLITEYEFNKIRSATLEKKVSSLTENDNNKLPENNVKDLKQISSDEHVLLFNVVGYISAFISLFFIPILFGAIGIVFGVLLTRRNSATNFTQGMVLIIISVATMIIGILFGIAAWSWYEIKK